MEFPERISGKITDVIAENLPDLSEEKLEQISYGIAIIIANSYKFIIIFTIAYLLKILGYVLLALLSFGLLRLFAAGLHAKKEWTCLITTAASLFGNVYLSKYIHFNMLVLSVIYLICFVITYKYAPSDTEERPIYSKSYRRAMKTLSCAVVAVLYALSLFYYGSIISSIIAISTIIGVVLIIPISYKLTGNVYGTGLYTNREV